MSKKAVTFENAKICIPTSSGGHLTHMLNLKPFWESHERFWVTFNKTDAVSRLEGEKKYWCYFPTNGNFFNLFRNFFLAWRMLKKEKPDIIISSGAAIAIPFFWLGKRFFNCICIYVEVYDRIDKPTKTGKFCKKLADKFFVQWESMLDVYPGSEYIGEMF